MTTLTQKNRLLKITTTLGEDAVILTNIKGHDELSKSFNYTLQLYSEHDCQKLLNTNVSCAYKDFLINGTLTHIRTLDTSEKLKIFEATLEPWFKTLDIKKQSRVFQKLSITELFSKICKENNCHDFSFSNLKETYSTINYCIQYEETAFNFLSRQLEAHGIFYTFRHEDHRHIMHLLDTHSLCPQSPITLNATKNPHEENHIHYWERCYKAHASEMSMQTGADNHFTSMRNADCDINLNQMKQTHQIFPHFFKDTDHATKTLTRYSQIDTWQANTIIARSHFLNITPGCFVDVAHPTQGGRYFVVSVSHHYKVNSMSRHCEEAHRADAASSASNSEQENNVVIATEAKQSRKNSNSILCLMQHSTKQESNTDELLFPREIVLLPSLDSFASLAMTTTLHLIPAEFPYAPPLSTPKPRMIGSFSATVVGPASEEFYINNKGQIKVQFPWDTENHHDEHASRWVPMTQAQTGKNVGTQFYPRIGDEVSVRFLYGDPDYPIVIGSYPNLKRKLIYANKYQSGMKTLDGNELRLDDAEGEESVLIDATNDLKINIGNQITSTITKNKSMTLGNNYSVHVPTMSINAKKVEFCVGNNSLIMDASGITITAAQIKVNEGSAPAARLGDNHSCPEPSRVGGPITEGSPNVFFNGLPVARVGDALQCHNATDTISAGISSIIVNGKAMAILGSACAHGGAVTSGSENVFVG